MHRYAHRIGSQLLAVMIFAAFTAGAANEVRGSTGIAEFLSGQAPDKASRPDPDPETPPSFAPGFRPESWEQWEIPGRMRRFSGRFHVGLANFLRDSFAFKTDNPTLYLATSEIVMLDSLWTGNSIVLSAEGTVHFIPLVGLTAELSWCSFRREVSPPPTYFTYQDSTHNQRLISTDDLNLFRFVICTRIDAAIYKVLFKPADLLVFDGAPEKSGLIPYIELGGGLSLIDRVGVNVSVTDGASTTTVRKALYERAINPAAVFGAGIEYRIDLFGLYVKFTYAWNGKPLSGWAPYTDTAGALSTWQISLGAAAYF